MEKHSEEIKNILGRPPRFLVRWGTFFIITALVGMLVGMYYISYPRKVQGRLVMSTVEPPISVVPQSSGYVLLFKKEGDTVSEGEQVALIRNQGEFEDVFDLEQLVINLLDSEGDDYLDYVPNESWVLGDIQEAYNNFNSTLDDFELAVNDRSDENKKNKYRNQIRNYQKSMEYLDDEVRDLEAQLNILNRGYNDAQKKLNDGEITDLEYHDYLAEKKSIEASIVNKKRNRERLETDISSSKFNIVGENLNTQRGSQSKLKNIKRELVTLKDAIDKWKSKYLLKAPIGGVVTFFNAQISERFIKEGDEFMAIVPQHELQDIIGIMEIPLVGAGKVKEGQRVLVKFDSYPFLEYGFVEARVKSKSLLPTPKEEKYDLQIELTDGLKMSRGDSIQFRQNMLADAEIITEDASLLKRVFGAVFNVFY